MNERTHERSHELRVAINQCTGTREPVVEPVAVVDETLAGGDLRLKSGALGTIGVRIHRIRAIADVVGYRAILNLGVRQSIRQNY